MATSSIKLLADGTQLDPGSTRTDHVALLLPNPGLMIVVHSLGDPEGRHLASWNACDKACRDLRLLGHSDWQLAGRNVWERHVLDLTHYDPAVDPNLYPGIKPKWHWTSTPAAWSALSAWGVFAGYGYVGSDRRGNVGFALAARRVGEFQGDKA